MRGGALKLLIAGLIMFAGWSGNADITIAADEHKDKVILSSGVLYFNRIKSIGAGYPKEHIKLK